MVLLVVREGGRTRAYLLKRGRGQVMGKLLGWRGWTWGLRDIWTVDLLGVLVLVLLWVRMKAGSGLKLGSEEGWIGHLVVVVDRGHLRLWVLVWILHLHLHWRVMWMGVGMRWWMRRMRRMRWRMRRMMRRAVMELAIVHRHRRRQNTLRRCRSILVRITPEEILSAIKFCQLSSTNILSVCVFASTQRLGKRGLLFVVVGVDEERRAAASAARRRSYSWFVVWCWYPTKKRANLGFSLSQSREAQSQPHSSPPPTHCSLP
jgi:hypothetical protein